MRPSDWVTIHNLAHKCAAMVEGTEFSSWSSHSFLKSVKDKAFQYINQYEHRVKVLEKNPSTGCGNQVIEVKASHVNIHRDVVA